MNDQIQFEPLTERETEILTLIAEGLSNREIAESLFIAHSTVRWYIRQIYGKLGAEDRDHAIILAGQLGLSKWQEPDGTNTLAQSISKLPTQFNEFIGRVQELRDLLAYVQNPDVRLISIIATGGDGKDTLSDCISRAHRCKYKAT